MKGFKNLVLRLTTEWNTKDGFITYEFSTNANNLPEKLEFLSTVNPISGEWILFFCDTCKKHNSDTPFHIEIRRS